MDESTLERMLHMAADLRNRLDNRTMTEGQRAFTQTLLAKLEAAFSAEWDQVEIIRAAMLHTDDAGGRATVAYIDRSLNDRSKAWLH
ncbi:hypothetical protein [Methylobacterium sp. E-046]|uniref:hypothetical protein n=1 Tax=Methylobacterium sp. E-046 TaxID=2836576 RepID=UPI001FBAB5A7|nr:hypothetical protein [Methylobacterium sp. E-046]MCJ2097496.1 hypothetical protein [Methylobacterium sp. E-046]